MKIASRFAIACAVMFVAAGSLAAQGTAQVAPPADPGVTAVPETQTPATAPATEQQASLSPFASNATVGVKENAPAAPAPFVPKRDKVGKNVALMIVGGAVLIVGAIVGGTAGTIIMVGGATIGIIGLYRYLQ